MNQKCYYLCIIKYRYYYYNKMVLEGYIHCIYLESQSMSTLQSLMSSFWTLWLILASLRDFSVRQAKTDGKQTFHDDITYSSIYYIKGTKRRGCAYIYIYSVSHSTDSPAAAGSYCLFKNDQRFKSRSMDAALFYLCVYITKKKKGRIKIDHQPSCFVARDI